MRFRRPLVVLLLVVLTGATGLYAIDRWGRQAGLPDGLIQASGRLEGDDVTVASKVAGRILTLHAREGDIVTQGQALAQLEDVQATARVAQAKQGEAALRAQLQAARSVVATLRAEVPLAIEAAEARLTRSQASLAKAEAEERQTRQDAQRFAALASRGSLGIQKSESAALAWTVAQRELDSARASLEESSRAVAQARLGWRRIETQNSQVAMLQAQLEQAAALVSDVSSVLADLTITAPISGVVLTRPAQVGEVVSAGGPLFTLVDLDHLYLKVYVPEYQIGKLRRGLPARIFSDAFADRFFPATVTYIAARAEFTPKEVQTPDERVKLVYAVKLHLDRNPDHRLTPGLPADAIIQWERNAPWTPPRW